MSNFDFDKVYTNISFADIEEKLTNNSSGGGNMRDLAAGYGGTAFDQYRRPGTFVPSDAFNEYAAFIASESMRYVGAGANTNIIQNFLSRIDRHGNSYYPLNYMKTGFTFITRPRLNMTSANLRQHPLLTTLQSLDPNSVPFMVRALLDTKMSRGESLFRGAGSFGNSEDEMDEFANLCAHSGLFDPLNPFFTPLQNGLVGISGFPDINIETETTDGDFHSGDFTFAAGSDMGIRSQELSLEFVDVQGSINLSIFFFWCAVMALQRRGTLMPYPDDEYENRLNYTVSIYRFVLDPSMKTILWWNKATGCFPKNAPVGALFNIQQGEVNISSATRFSIPFTANVCEWNNPAILQDFNLLMQRYNSNITNPNYYWEVPEEQRFDNYDAYPYIKVGKSGVELKWLTSNTLSADINERAAKLEELRQKVITEQTNERKRLLEMVGYKQSNSEVPSDDVELTYPYIEGEEPV